MTIHVKAGKVRLHLWLPTSILKSRLGYKAIKRAIEESVQKSSSSEEPITLQNDDTPVAVTVEPQMGEGIQAQTATISREQVLEMYKTLKRYVKQNGHFNLVEVDSHDGEKVKIRV